MVALKALTLMRPRHWVKNIFLFAPLVFTPSLYSQLHFLNLMIGFLCFSFISSAVYVMNDFKDQDADRLHPVKKKRPIASGEISNITAIILFFILCITAISLSYVCLNLTFLAVLMTYFCINLLYCFYTKNYSIFDVLSIAFGFVLRVAAGASIIGVTASIWLLLCTGFIALFLAFAKRRDDLVNNVSPEHRPALSGYNILFVDIASTVSLTSVLICYALYTNSPIVHETISRNLYLTIPFVVIGIFRYMQITFVEKKSGDPTHIVTSDKVILLSLLGWCLTLCVILLGGY